MRESTYNGGGAGSGCCSSGGGEGAAMGERGANAEWKDLAAVAADEAGVGGPETAVVQWGAVCRVMQMRPSSRSVKPAKLD